MSRPFQLRDALRLMVITDRRLAGQRSWTSLIEAALEAGATSIQLRDKQAPSYELLEMARRVTENGIHLGWSKP